MTFAMAVVSLTLFAVVVSERIQRNSCIQQATQPLEVELIIMRKSLNAIQKLVCSQAGELLDAELTIKGLQEIIKQNKFSSSRSDLN